MKNPLHFSDIHNWCVCYVNIWWLFKDELIAELVKFEIVILCASQSRKMFIQQRTKSLCWTTYLRLLYARLYICLMSEARNSKIHFQMFLHGIVGRFCWLRHRRFSSSPVDHACCSWLPVLTPLLFSPHKFCSSLPPSIFLCSLGLISFCWYDDMFTTLYYYVRNLYYLVWPGFSRFYIILLRIHVVKTA